MEELFNIIFADIVDFGNLAEYIVLVRIIIFMVLFETLGVVIGHLSKLGR